MNIQSRLEIYPSKDVKDRSVIIGERRALRELGQALIRASENAAGFESITLYKGNGHGYEIFITKNVDESEWQSIPEDPNNINFIYEYDRLKKQLVNVKL